MKTPSIQGRRIAGVVLLVVLVVSMVLNTRFLTPDELAAAQPTKFDPKATADDLFQSGLTELPKKATPLTELVPALLKNTVDAGKQFDAVAPTETSLVFAVTATGTVTEVRAGTLTLKVDGLPQDPLIQVPTTNAVNGTVLRDVLGFRFADAPGQSDYQYVGDELKKLMQKEVAPVATDSGLRGKTVTVVGAITVLNGEGGQPEAKPVSIQPLTLEQAS